MAFCAEDGRWEEGLQVARNLLHSAPERSSGWLHQSYAMRRVPNGGVQQAFDALLPAFEKFPEEPTIPYNLSCYACQLGDLQLAREWFHRALGVGNRDRIKQMAREDDFQSANAQSRGGGDRVVARDVSVEDVESLVFENGP